MEYWNYRIHIIIEISLENHRDIIESKIPIFLIYKEGNIEYWNYRDIHRTKHIK